METELALGPPPTIGKNLKPDHELKARNEDRIREFVRKGRVAYGELYDATHGVATYDTTHEKMALDYSANWNIGTIEGILPPFADFALKRIGKDHSNFKEYSAMPKLRPRSRFSNYYGLTEGVILAIDNLSMYNGFAPDKLSDVMWAFWKTWSTDPSVLQYIIQVMIGDGQTSGILNHFAGGRRGDDGQGRPLVSTWTRDDDAFYALLQSPNGIGVVWMLTDYASSMDYKTVTKISAYFDPTYRKWVMWFELGKSGM